MKTKLCVFVLILWVGMLCGSVGASGADWSQHALIVATPKSVRPTSSVEESTLETMTLTFEVALRDIEVVYGDFREKRATVVLSATSREVLRKHRRIYVLLASEGDERKAVSWGVPTEVACFPADVVKEESIAADFSIRDVRSNRMCTNIHWFK